MEFDLHTSVLIAQGITPTDGAAAGASTASAAVDTVSFESFEWVISAGTITTGDFTVLLEQSDTGAFGGEETTVPADGILGDLPTFAASDDDAVKRVGVLGKERYQRLTLVGTNTPVGDFAVLAVLSHARSKPTADQS